MAKPDPSSDLYQRAKLLVFDAAEQPATERAVFLDRMCGSDRALRSEVESLLDYGGDRGDAFSETALHRGRELLREALAPTDGEDAGATVADELPVTVGRYEIIRLLGRGGMGEVFEARQQRPQRRVAVKLIRPGAVSPGTIWKHTTYLKTVKFKVREWQKNLKNLPPNSHSLVKHAVWG